jgi:hypothetical protein
LSEIQKGDPDAKRKAIWLLVLCSIVGSVVLGSYSYFEAEIHRWIYRSIDFLISNPLAVCLPALVFVIPILLFSVYLFIYGYRASQAKRMPPPGYSVVKDTVVLSGLKAIRMGRLVQFISLVLLLAGASIPGILWYVFDRVVSSAA